MLFRKHWKVWLALFAVLALVVAACGNDDDDGSGAPAPDDAPAADDAPADDGAADDGAADDGADDAPDVDMTPGEGVSVTMARANWSTGYMQAAIYHHLLEELGFEVSEPADLELAPSNAYLSMAQGEFDFWANSWYPNHDSFVAGEMPDAPDVDMTPGEGVSVTMARANWSTGYMQAAIYHHLLEELGFEVSEPERGFGVGAV